MTLQVVFVSETIWKIILPYIVKMLCAETAADEKELMLPSHPSLISISFNSLPDVISQAHSFSNSDFGKQR